MRQTCPKSCPSAKEPFSGFHLYNYRAGESFLIEAGELNHLVFVISGKLTLDSEECSGLEVGKGSFFFCYNCK